MPWRDELVGAEIRLSNLSSDLTLVGATGVFRVWLFVWRWVEGDGDAAKKRGLQKASSG